MKDEKPIVTLIGTGQAEIGKVFIHKWPSSKCESCKYSSVCIRNLEPDRVYKVIKVRDKTLPCDLCEMEMRVVEVVDAEIPAAVPSKQAIERATITARLPNCKEQDCENYKLCFPIGLKDGVRCEILDVTESLRCLQELPLKKVLLRRARAS